MSSQGGYIGVNPQGSSPLANPVVGGSSGIVTGTERERLQNIGAELLHEPGVVALTQNVWTTVATLTIPANTVYDVFGRLTWSYSGAGGTSLTMTARLYDGATVKDTVGDVTAGTGAYQQKSLPMRTRISGGGGGVTILLQAFSALAGISSLGSQQSRLHAVRVA